MRSHGRTSLTVAGDRRTRTVTIHWRWSMPLRCVSSFLASTPRPPKHPAPLHFHFIYMVIEGNSSVATLQIHPRFSLLNLLELSGLRVYPIRAFLSRSLKVGFPRATFTSTQWRSDFQAFHSRRTRVWKHRRESTKNNSANNARGFSESKDSVSLFVSQYYLLYQCCNHEFVDLII